MGSMPVHRGFPVSGNRARGPGREARPGSRAGGNPGAVTLEVPVMLLRPVRRRIAAGGRVRRH
jgi:hypothetical protein